MRLRTIVAICAMTMLVSPAIGGHGTTTGKEPGRFTTDGYKVIVAVIREVHRAEGEGFQPYRATLEPRATLAGAFDPSLHPYLGVRFYAGGYGTSIEQAPPNGATVLAVIRTDL